MEEGRFVVVLVLLLILVVGGCNSKRSIQLSQNATYEEIINAAVKMNDARICSRFAEEPILLVTGNITLAENVDIGCVFGSGCISAVALSAMDSNLCKKMKECEYLGVSAHDACISNIEFAKVQDVAMRGDYRNCMGLKGTITVLGDEVERKELCLNYVGINQTDHNVCEMIEKASRLRDTCLLSVTILENNADSVICDKIMSEEIKSICLQDYEQVKESP